MSDQSDVVYGVPDSLLLDVGLTASQPVRSAAHSRASNGYRCQSYVARLSRRAGGHSVFQDCASRPTDCVRRATVTAAGFRDIVVRWPWFSMVRTELL